MSINNVINEQPERRQAADETQRSRRGRWWTAGRIALKSILIFGAVVAVAAAGIADAAGGIYTDRAETLDTQLAVPTAPSRHDPAKPTAVIVLSPAGTNVADTLPPYEVLASTGAFNVYTVAAGPEPVPLTGGLDLVPDLTFDELDELVGAPADVIVIPQLTDSAEPSSEPIVDWLDRQRTDGDPLLVTICVGTEVLADAGWLDGRPATSHWLGLIGLRRNYPAVDWQDGVRYVDDGDVITSAGVLSGVDGTLRVVERMVGTDAAEQAAQAVNWPYYNPGEAAAIERSRPAPADLVALLSAAYRFDRPDTGVLLTDGVGETELASAFRPYTELSYLADPLAVTADGGPIESNHGLVFVPRADLASAAPDLDRLLVPGADAARTGGDLGLPGGLAPVYLHEEDGFAFDGPLRDIADTYDVATARWVAKSLAYEAPTDLEGTAWPWSLTLRPILIGLGAAVVVALGARLPRRRTASADRRDTVRSGDLRGRPTLRLVRHYLEMLVAMAVGMFALGYLEFWLFASTGWARLQADPEIAALTMATNMTVPLVALMLWRRRSRAAIAETAAAMYASFAIFFPPLWFGALTGADVMLLGHVAMVVALAAAMLWRRDEYTGRRERVPESALASHV